LLKARGCAFDEVCLFYKTAATWNSFMDIGSDGGRLDGLGKPERFDVLEVVPADISNDVRNGDKPLNHVI